MKSLKSFTYLIFAVSIASLVACQSGAPAKATRPPSTATPAAPPAASYQFDANWDNRAVFRKGLIGAEQAVLDQLPGASVYHIDLHIPSDYSPLTGRQQIRYTNREDEPRARRR